MFKRLKKGFFNSTALSLSSVHFIVQFYFLLFLIRFLIFTGFISEQHETVSLELAGGVQKKAWLTLFRQLRASTSGLWLSVTDVSTNSVSYMLLNTLGMVNI